MFFWLVVLVLLYLAAIVVVAVGLPFVLFPPGHQTKAGQVQRWGEEHPRWVLYLQGNAEDVTAQNWMVAWFLRHRWGVVSVGYARSFDRTEKAILTAVRDERTRRNQQPWGVYSHSLGSCFAPTVCQTFAGEPKFAIYATPLSSVGRVFNHHTRYLLGPVAPYLWGADRGLLRHNVVEPLPLVVLADNDTLTPADVTRAALAEHKVETSGVHVLKGTHNDFYFDPAFSQLLEEHLE